MHTILPSSFATASTGTSKKLRMIWKPRTAALVAVAAGAMICLHTRSLEAQYLGGQALESRYVEAQSTKAEQTVPAARRTTLDLRAALTPPLDLSTASATDAAASTSSSLNDSADASADSALAEERLSLSDVNQPPPRRRYGRPRYSDRTHNADGSNKFAFAFGGGLTVPVGGAANDLTTSYRFMVGGGYNFSKKFGVMAQFDYDHFGLPGKVIANQQALYASLQIIDPSTGTSIDVSGLDANSHIWSLTLNPTFTVVQGEQSSAYVVVGGGYYRKTVNFTLPTTGAYCDYYGFCYQVTSNENFDSYSNNSLGINGGLGYTYKLSRFSNAKLFAEARYVWVANQKNNQTLAQSAAQGNYYPQANDRSSYIPITFGVRW
jgi:hypothetical protein